MDLFEKVMITGQKVFQETKIQLPAKTPWWTLLTAARTHDP
jgi:hypothetical protein